MIARGIDDRTDRIVVSDDLSFRVHHRIQRALKEETSQGLFYLEAGVKGVAHSTPTPLTPA